MAWICPPYIKTNYKSGNDELALLTGELSDYDAKIALVKYLRANIGIACELITGIKLEPFQEIIIRNLFNANYSMLVMGRGCSKSFCAAIFCILYPIFYPNTKIILAGPTFRTARNIFEEMEKFIEDKNAAFASSCFIKDNKKRNSDMFSWKINGGSIRAIPLAGERIRGFRANVLICDEYLLLPEDIIKRILMPFLVAPNDITQRQKIIEEESKLIRLGKMVEADRTNFDSESKMIALSSASFTFENLYKTFCEWTENITDKDKFKRNQAKYFIAQVGFEALPKHMINQTVIEEAESGGRENDAFLREYCAQFVDGSDSYFSPKKMKELTLQGGDRPCVKLTGEDDKEYILAIDPNFGNSPGDDHFAMSLLELDYETKHRTLVHSYGEAGADWKDHTLYLYYLLRNFNIRMIVVDNAGWGFIETSNESPIFKEAGINIKFLDIEMSKEGYEHDGQIARFRRDYNPGDHRICVRQHFNYREFIPKANQELQYCIDKGIIFFGSGIKAVGNESEFYKSNHYLKSGVIKREWLPKPFRSDDARRSSWMTDFIDYQDDWINMTQKECSLVEVKNTARGFQSFDLPRHLKNSSSPNKARKDNYTTLMLANWATRFYFDTLDVKEKPVLSSFRPRRVGSGGSSNLSMVR